MQEPNGTLIFDYLLSALLDITNSPYGWISSALLKADGTPYLKVSLPLPAHGALVQLNACQMMQVGSRREGAI